jgi:hypothetical protein
MNRRRTPLLGVSLAMVLVLGLCGSASAVTTARSVTGTNFSGQVNSVTSACVGAERLAMAGFTAQITLSQAVTVSSFAPTGTGLKVTAFNIGSDGDLTSTSYCTTDPIFPATTQKKAKKKKKKKKKKKHSASSSKKKKKKKKKKKPAVQQQPAPPVPVTSTSPIGAGDPSGTATVTCPSGTTVRAGGLDKPTAMGDLYTASSMEMLSPTQLKVAVQDFMGGSTDATSVTAVALCGQGPPLTTAPGPLTAIPSFDFATSTATCPAGTVVAFGGFKEGPLDNGYVQMLARASDSTVTATAFSTIAGNSIQAFAYCV